MTAFDTPTDKFPVRVTVDCMIPFCGWSVVGNNFDKPKADWLTHALSERHNEGEDGGCPDGPVGHGFADCRYNEHIIEDYRRSHDPDDGFSASNVHCERRRRHPETA